MLGQRQQGVLLPGLTFLEHLGDLLGLLAGGSALAGGQGVVNLILLELSQTRFQLLQVGPEVVVEHLVEGVLGVAVQVDQAGEAPFGALHHPVDRPLLVGLQVILVEVSAEVFADVFAERVLDEAEVFGDAALGEGDLQELAGAGDDVVFKPLAVENWDDAVGVGLELDFAQGLADFFFIGNELISLAVVGVSQNQSRLIEAVAALAARHMSSETVMRQPEVCSGVVVAVGRRC